MTVTVSNTSFYSSGAISFSSMRTNFKQTDTGSISASELRRNTSTSSSTPIVPDATENSSITTSNNWKTSQFRNSIKYYNIIQTDTNLNLDIGNSSFWNGNLTKNVNKRVYINGTCGSNSTSTAAALLSSLVYNILITVSGRIYGAAGSGGTSSSISGGSGGNALSINPGSSSSNIVVQVNSTANIYGGGGGGEFGATGATGATGTCINSDSYTNYDGCNGCKGCASGYYQTACFRWAQCACSWGICAQSYGYTCQRDLYYSVGGGPGGVGGNGGTGRGYNNFSGSVSGSAGSAGSGGGCAGYTSSGSPAPQPGATGETGGSGGDWGSAGGSTGSSGSGGAAGRAIQGSNYRVSGVISSITIKGSY